MKSGWSRDVLEEIGKNSKTVAYGKKEVTQAAQSGAAETMLVIDEMVKNRDIETTHGSS